MTLQEIVVTGISKPDGTLDLDQKLNLAPGRVTVVLRQESEAPACYITARSITKTNQRRRTSGITTRKGEPRRPLSVSR